MKNQAIESISSAEPAGSTLIELTMALTVTAAMLSGSVVAFVQLAVRR